MTWLSEAKEYGEEGGVSKYSRKEVSLIFEPLISTTPQGDFFSRIF